MTKKILTVFAAVVLSLITAVPAAADLTPRKPLPVPVCLQREVPNVVGLPLADARTVLAIYGFDRIRVNTALRPKYTYKVYNQSPAKYTLVNTCLEVTLYARFW